MWGNLSLRSQEPEHRTEKSSKNMIRLRAEWVNLRAAWGHRRYAWGPTDLRSPGALTSCSPIAGSLALLLWFRFSQICKILLGFSLNCGHGWGGQLYLLLPVGFSLACLIAGNFFRSPKCAFFAFFSSAWLRASKAQFVFSGLLSSVLCMFFGFCRLLW